MKWHCHESGWWAASTGRKPLIAFRDSDGKWYAAHDGKRAGPFKNKKAATAAAESSAWTRDVRVSPLENERKKA